MTSNWLQYTHTDRGIEKESTFVGINSFPDFEEIKYLNNHCARKEGQGFKPPKPLSLSGFPFLQLLQKPYEGKPALLNA